jgi:hypothetical protein
VTRAQIIAEHEAPHMTTQELTQAASQIAGGMLAALYGKSGTPSDEALAHIARVSVQIARKIEEEARARPKGGIGENWRSVAIHTDPVAVGDEPVKHVARPLV